MPRITRQPEQRPDAILAAAFDAFAEKGYAETRMEDVAQRAGISKGLVYVYFKTKEELLKAVIRAVLVPRVEQLMADVAASDLSARELMRGPLLTFMRKLATSRMHLVLRLLISEGPKHPDLTAFYHQEIIGRGRRVAESLIARGIARGEFRETALREFPHLLVAPMLMALVWKSLFERHEPLDVDRMLALHVEMVIDALTPRAAGTAP
jgi:AcrR family transcriptional regulator